MMGSCMGLVSDAQRPSNRVCHHSWGRLETDANAIAGDLRPRVNVVCMCVVQDLPELSEPRLLSGRIHDPISPRYLNNFLG